MIDVHPTAIIGPGVQLGEGVYVGPFVTIDGDITIGAGSYIGTHTIIGAPPEHGVERYGVTDKPCGSRITIGAGTEIREHVTIHAPMEPDGVTSIGDRCMVMSHAHLGHDVRLDNDVKIATGAILGGHTRVHVGANIGLGAVTHQRSTIGAYAMVGANSFVGRDVPPAALVHGVPALVHSINRVGLERAGFDADEIAAYFRDRIDGKPPPPHLAYWWAIFEDDSRRQLMSRAE